MNTLEILFSCIRSEIFGAKPDNFLLEDSDTCIIEQLYSLSKAHDVAHIVAAALEKNSLPIGKEFQKQMALAVFRYEQIVYETQRICDVFEKKEIEHIKLKGAVIRDLYPNPWQRTSCDIDILVHEEDLQRACNALCAELGYNCSKTRNYHDIDLYSQNNVHLELHFNIKETIPSIDHMLEKVWDYTEKVEGKTYQYRQTNEFLIFHMVAHTSYHLVGGGCGIRPFIDLQLLRGIEHDREKLKKLLSECSLEKFYDFALTLADVWFSGKEHTNLTKQVQSYLLGGGVYGTRENKIAVQQLRQGGKIKYALYRIFMPREKLKIKYPIIEKYSILTPFCQIHRWITIIFDGRLGKSMSEFEINNKTSVDKSKKVNKMLKEIGL